MVFYTGRKYIRIVNRKLIHQPLLPPNRAAFGENKGNKYYKTRGIKGIILNEKNIQSFLSLSLKFGLRSRISKNFSYQLTIHLKKSLTPTLFILFFFDQLFF